MLYCTKYKLGEIVGKIVFMMASVFIEDQQVKQILMASVFTPSGFTGHQYLMTSGVGSLYNY